VVAGRYGLSSKEFTPAMVKAVFDELGKDKPKHKFTIGIVDDVTHRSLPWTPPGTSSRRTWCARSSTAWAPTARWAPTRNSIKIIGEETENYGQGYFVYDSKKSGANTISHLRFGPRPIRSSYLVTRANSWPATSSSSSRSSTCWSTRYPARSSC